MFIRISKYAYRGFINFPFHILMGFVSYPGIRIQSLIFQCIFILFLTWLGLIFLKAVFMDLGIGEESGKQ